MWLDCGPRLAGLGDSLAVILLARALQGMSFSLVPIGIIVQDQPRWELLAVAGVCALILLKHTANIKRLIRREEHSLGQN